MKRHHEAAINDVSVLSRLAAGIPSRQNTNQTWIAEAGLLRGHVEVQEAAIETHRDVEHSAARIPADQSISASRGRVPRAACSLKHDLVPITSRIDSGVKQIASAGFRKVDGAPSRGHCGC